jgi:hypothetical protein
LKLALKSLGACLFERRSPQEINIMKHQPTILAAFIGLALASATGCLGNEREGDPEALGTRESAAMSLNRLTMNHLNASSLGVTQLSAAALSSNGTTITQSALLTSKSRRDVLTYLVRCALPMGMKISGSSGGKSYAFSGLIGLAPEWLGAPLTTSGRHWVSACMLAHVNGYEEQVPISLRGAHPALATSAAEVVVYAVEEMAFYGDIFDANKNLMFACAGKGAQAAYTADPDEHMPRRSCDEDDPCLLNVPGPCHDITLLGAGACEGGGAGLSSSCHASLKPGNQGWPAGDPAYAEVITVYMELSDFEEYYNYDDFDVLGIEL